MNSVAKALISAGLLLTILGLLAWAGQPLGLLRLGRLPGDFRIERSGFSFYFPLTTMLLLSAVVTGLLYLTGRFRR